MKTTTIQIVFLLLFALAFFGCSVYALVVKDTTAFWIALALSTMFLYLTFKCANE